MSTALIEWLIVMGATIIWGALSDKNLQEFILRMRFVGIFAFIIITLSHLK